MRETAGEQPVPSGLTLTLEHGLYVAILLAGAALRWADLDALPLRGAESENALRAWALLQGQPGLRWDEPLLTLAVWGLFFLFGASDVAARAGPLLWGLGGIAACWLFRGSLGRVEALVLALLLAVSPTAVYASRLLSGDAPALTLLLVGLGLLLRPSYAAKPSEATPLAMIVVLLFLLGAPGITASGLLITAGVLITIFGPHPAGSLSFSWKPLLYGGGIIVSVYAVVGTGFFAFPEGLSLDPLRRWALLFERSADALPWYLPLLTLVAYEPLVAVVGIGVTGRWFFSRLGGEKRRHLSESIAMLLWPLALVLALLMETKDGVDLLPTVLFLSIVTARAIGQGIRAIHVHRRRWLHPAALVPGFLLFLCVLVTARLVREGTSPQLQEDIILGLWLALPIGVAVGLLVWLRRAIAPALLALGLIALFALSWRWGIALNTRPGPQEFFARSWPAAEARSFASLIVARGESASSSNVAPLAVDASLRFPWAWYLREGQPLRFFRGKPPQAAALLISGEVEPALGSGYGMMKSQAEESWVPQQFSLVRWWRWMLYREPWGTVKRRWVGWYERG